MNTETTKAKNKLTFTDWARARSAFIIDPIVTFLARYRLSPDSLTVIGMLAHFGVAWLISIGSMTWAAVALAVFGSMDALDGALARKIGRKQGGFGAFLDSTLDRIAEIILFGGFMIYFVSQENFIMLAVTYIAITGSLMVSYSRGRAEGLGYDGKVGILGRLERYIVVGFFTLINMPQVALVTLAIFTYITVGQRMYHVWRQAQQEQP